MMYLFGSERVDLVQKSLKFWCLVQNKWAERWNKEKMLQDTNIIILFFLKMFSRAIKAWELTKT